MFVTMTLQHNNKVIAGVESHVPALEASTARVASAGRLIQSDIHPLADSRVTDSRLQARYASWQAPG